MHSLFIWISFFLAFFFNFFLFGTSIWIPDFVLICIIFWIIYQNSKIDNIVLSFFFGLIIDMYYDNLLGQQACIYSILACITVRWKRRMLILNYTQQAIQLLPLFLINSIWSLIVYWIISKKIPIWAYANLTSACIAAFFWPFIVCTLLFFQKQLIKKNFSQ